PSKSARSKTAAQQTATQAPATPKKKGGSSSSGRSNAKSTAAKKSAPSKKSAKPSTKAAPASDAADNPAVEETDELATDALVEDGDVEAPERDLKAVPDSPDAPDEADAADGAEDTEEVAVTDETPTSESTTDAVNVPGETGFVVSDTDDDDAPVQQVVTAGATADPVKDYLKQIGKVALLNAEQEVELAKRIEAGLFAEEKLASEEGLPSKLRRELQWIANDGRLAKNHLLEANLRLVVSLAKRYTGRGMLF